MATTNILPFQLDFDKSELRKTSYKTTITTTTGDVQTSETKKKEVPMIAAGATLHEIIYCINEFFQAKKALAWTSGQKCFDNFPDIFEDPQDKNFWDLTVNAEPDRSNDSFRTCINTYIAHKFSDNFRAYRQHQRFIRNIKKTKSLSVHQFVSLIQYHSVNVLPFLPGAPNIAAFAQFSPADLKDIIFNAMPEDWIYEFDTKHDVESATLQEIVRFMDKLYFKSERTKNANKKNNQGGNNNSSGRNSNGNRNGGGRNKGGDRNDNESTGDSRRRKNKKKQRDNDRNRRIRPDDPCPLPGHRGHTWGQCYHNANNTNRPNYNGNNNGGGNNNNRNSGRDNHINENDGNRHSQGRNQSHDNNRGTLTNQNNPQQGDNYYCHFINQGTTDASNTADLFHVDCCVDDHYYNDDLQRFPKSNASNNITSCNYEEVFQQESSYQDGIDSDDSSFDSTQKEKRMQRVHFSPAPPSNATGVLRLSKPQIDEDVAPTTVLVWNQINEGPKKKGFGKTLLDSGSTDNIITKSTLPKDVDVLKLASPITMSTAQGQYICDSYVYLHNVMMPELSLTRRCKRMKCLVIDTKMNYHVILGRKYMKQIGIQMDFAQSTVNWYGKQMSFHPRSYFNDNEILRKVLSNEPYAIAESYAAQTKSHVYEDAASKYEKTDLDDLINGQSHLTTHQRETLRKMLSKHSVLFAGLNDRHLGIFPNRTYHIDLQDGAKAYHIKQPYSVPLHQQEAVKKELLRQLKLDIIERCYATEWGMPIFIIPKPDGSCRLISDFRELNKVTKQLHFPIPKLQDIFHRRRNFKFVTLIDVSMQFHTFLLDEESRNLCVLVTPWGKFQYKRLPMGFLNSPSWAQAAMDELFSDLSDVEVYIDDIGIFSNNFEEHVRVVQIVLNKLEQHNFTVKPAKCHWFQSQAPWLGHIVTPTGILPDPDKIKPILQLSFPKTITELRSFVGMVNFYRSFWKQRADIMAPLTALSGRAKGKLTPTPVLLNSFKRIKQLIAEKVLLIFPNPNKPYYIYTDASDTQLGAVIKQHNDDNELLPVVFFSRKLSSAQQKYPTIDKEMLCIVEILKEYRPILWGAEIHVYTDHINLTRQSITSNRIMTWRMLCEEFAPVFHYIKGPENIEADALSRLPFEEEKGPAPSPPHDATSPAADVKSTDNTNPQLTEIDSKSNDNECLSVDDLYINYPSDLPNFPIAFPLLEKAQQEDDEIQSTKHYKSKVFYEYNLMTYTKNEHTKIVLPKSLIPQTIKWYHFTMGHAGADRLYRSINQFLYAPGLKEAVRNFCKTCDACQRYKNPGIGIGHLPPKDESMVPFEQIAIDTIGPWTVNIPGSGKATINAYSIIDTASNLLELRRATQMNPTGRESVEVLEEAWLSRYPKPVRIIYDQGKEYANVTFESYLIAMGIVGRPSTVKNPQSNAILERVHDVMKSSLRTEALANPPQNQEGINRMIEKLLSSAQYAVRVCVHSTFGISPGALVFQRDMLLPIPIIVDLRSIRRRRQVLIDQNNLRENRRRRQHDYTVGDQFLIISFKPDALSDRAKGPFTITQVHSNGTVSYMLNEAVIDRINIRRIKPYYRTDTTE